VGNPFQYAFPSHADLRSFRHEPFQFALKFLQGSFFLNSRSFSSLLYSDGRADVDFSFQRDVRLQTAFSAPFSRYLFPCQSVKRLLLSLRYTRSPFFPGTSSISTSSSSSPIIPGISDPPPNLDFSTKRYRRLPLFLSGNTSPPPHQRTTPAGSGSSSAFFLVGLILVSLISLSLLFVA